MPQLGAASGYQVVPFDRGGGTPVGDPLPVTDLSWGRVLGDTSDAEVTIDLSRGPLGDDMAATLAALRSWRHELVVWRDGVRVWEGPITRITTSRTRITLAAADVSAWLAKRAIRTDHCWAAECGGQAADLGDVARALVLDAVSLDDPGIHDHLLMEPVGIYGERTYDAWSTYALDALGDLARTAIDWTVIGRRLVSGPPGVFGRVPATWTCDHIAGDVQTVEDGLAAANRAAVLGGAPEVPEGQTAAPVHGLAGDRLGDPYYGLLEVLAKDDDLTDRPTLDAAAAGLLQPAPPLYVDVPSGSTLAAETPCGINDLVPGVLVPLAVDCLARPIHTTQRLASLAVRWGDRGEQVAVSLVQPVPD